MVVTDIGVGSGDCCGHNRYRRGLGTAGVVTDIGVEGDCCGQNRYQRGLGTSGVVIDIGVGVGTAVVITDIRGG